MSKAKKPAAVKKVVTPKIVGDVFRVYRLDETLRDSVKVARAASGKTTRDWLRDALSDHLPQLVKECLALGLRPADGKTRPARLPLRQELLSALAEAAIATTLPRQQLLLLVMARAAAEITPAAKARAKSEAVQPKNDDTPKTTGKKRGRKPKTVAAAK